MRDWSNEGVEERNTCYKPIIEDILKEFPLDTYVFIILLEIANFSKNRLVMAVIGFQCPSGYVMIKKNYYHFSINRKFNPNLN